MTANVAAVAPQSTRGDLPFVGEGYGVVLIAVVLVVAVIILALRGILAGEAVATLFGGLLGYIFGTTRGAGSTKSGTEGTEK